MSENNMNRLNLRENRTIVLHVNTEDIARRVQLIINSFNVPDNELPNWAAMRFNIQVNGNRNP